MVDPANFASSSRTPAIGESQIMPNNRAQLVDSYLAIRHRIKNFAALHLLVVEFASATRTMDNPMGLKHADFAEVLRDVWIGYFASLLDCSKGATNAPKVWKALFPEKAAKVRQWEQDSQSYLKTLRNYRNVRSFHANENLVKQVATWREYQNAKDNITKLIQAFFDIAIEIIAEEHTLDDIAVRIEACSRQINREQPGATFDADFLAKYIFGPFAFHTST
jgi:hypothetical protein